MHFQACEKTLFKRARARLTSILLAAFSVLLFIGPSPALSSDSNRSAWTDNDSMLLFFEAVGKIRTHSLNSESIGEIVRKSLREYLRKEDPFADYLTSEEYAAFKLAFADNRYAGVGMDLAVDSTGKIVCIPFPDSPAERGGIGYEDILVAVNAAPVEGRSIFSIGKDVRGPQGTTVTLTIRSQAGKVREVALIREAIQFKSVRMELLDRFAIIRILRFTPHTPEELKRSFAESARENLPVAIDLRGNTGGDMFAAIDCASLFLPSGRRIALVKTRHGEQWYSSRQKPIDDHTTLYLWQDKHTASAAEVFSAALTENGRAISIGDTTFGKGVAQRFVELTNGSVLLLTYAEIFPPNSGSFHGKGLKPFHPLAATAGTAQDRDRYVGGTIQLILKSLGTLHKSDGTAGGPPKDCANS